jgi:hypothetical protein
MFNKGFTLKKCSTFSFQYINCYSNKNLNLKKNKLFFCIQNINYLVQKNEKDDSKLCLGALENHETSE